MGKMITKTFWETAVIILIEMPLQHFWYSLYGRVLKQ